MVFYEVYIGTRKFLSNPVATTSYTTDSELPMISLCQFRKSHFTIGYVVPHNMTYDHYRNGKFYSDYKDSHVSAEDVFERSFDDNYYLLDITGKKSNTTLGIHIDKVIT